MEAYDATRLVYSRVQLLEPDRASKIMGVLLLQEEGEQHILRLATGPDSMLQAAVAKAKSQLGLAAGGLVESSCFSGGVFPNDHFYPETFAFLNSSKARAAETSGAGWQWRLPGPSASSSAPQQQQDGGGLAGVSIERLEAELHELLCGRRGPVSIAALPQLYYEAFGRPLQADGYLTESQRHGKSGHNLTRLLSRLKGNTITLLDRPHGQHAVVLTQDAHKFAAGDQYDLSGVNPSSRQIYLTFPADSGFSEDDVNIHFRAYGPVQDVRIPYQQQRMFGFVTFVYPETVRIVLSEGNPHYICGARVLVKPYRERGKVHERKHNLAAAGDSLSSSSSQHQALFKLLDGTQFPSLGESHHSSLSNKAQQDEGWNAATVAPSS